MFPDIPGDVQRAADRAALLYLCDPNVSLIDIGWRIHDREDHAVEPELCVRVHLRRKLRGEAFRAFAERYPQRVVEPDLIGFTVDIPGDVNYRPHLITGFAPVFSFRTITTTNPLCGGISISNAVTFSAGTLGGWVRDRHTQADMILSNWHVLCCPWADWDDLPIYQPGRLDGGYAESTVAYLARHSMEQNIDAAVGILTGTRDLINNQRGIGIVTGVAIPRLGMQVIKSGRTTGVTAGIIDGVGGRRIFNYGGISHMIREHIHIIPIPDGVQIVSSAGDSGAWWLEESTNRAVGLHFGGSDDPEYALAFSMPAVLDTLQVDIFV